MEEKQKKRRISFILITIVIIALLVSITIYLINQEKKEELETSNQEEKTQENIGLIDMQNTENVEIKEGMKENNSEILLKDKTFEGMKISEIRLVAENGMTNFTAKVENTSQKDFQERDIVIVFKNQDGTEYARLNGFLPDIKVGESNIIDSSTTADIANAYDFIIE